jgi:hypothetical protein
LNSKVSGKAAEHSFAKKNFGLGLSESSFGKAVLCRCLTLPLLVMPWSYYPSLKGLNSLGLSFPNLKSDLL